MRLRPGVVTVEVLEEIRTVGSTIEDRHLLRDRAEAAVLAALGTS